MDVTPRLCECGCGQQTPLVSHTHARDGRVKGEPNRFIRGHNGRLNGNRAHQNRFRIAPDGSIEKRCTRCKEFKPIVEPLGGFNRSATRRDGLRAHCKSCEREQAIGFYKQNPEPYKKRAVVSTKALRLRVKDRAERIRIKYGCQLCPERDTCCLDFHHVMGRGLDRAVGHCDTMTSLEREIAKCVVVCASCHRKVHAGHLVATVEMCCKADDCRDEKDA